MTRSADLSTVPLIDLVAELNRRLGVGESTQPVEFTPSVVPFGLGDAHRVRCPEHSFSRLCVSLDAAEDALRDHLDTVHGEKCCPQCGATVMPGCSCDCGPRRCSECGNLLDLDDADSLIEGVCLDCADRIQEEDEGNRLAKLELEERLG